MLFFPLLLLPILGFISYTDLKQGIIPDIAVVFLAFIGLIHLGLTNPTLIGLQITSAIIVGICVIILRKIVNYFKKTPSLGWGDVKFITAAILWIPLPNIPIFFIISGFCGILTCMAWKKLYDCHTFPFGPSLCAGLLGSFWI
jgi:leader peptidase (prepilin peptidase)/N-methyltransferase